MQLSLLIKCELCMNSVCRIIAEFLKTSPFTWLRWAVPVPVSLSYYTLSRHSVVLSRVTTLLLCIV